MREPITVCDAGNLITVCGGGNNFTVRGAVLLQSPTRPHRGHARDLDSADLGCEAAPEHYGYRVGACFIFGGGLRSIFDDYDLDLRQECSAGGARLKYRNAGRRAAACVCIS